MKKLIICSMIFLAGITNLSAIIVQAPNLSSLEKQLDELDENGLVVLDVDYTILIPNDQVLRPCGEKYVLQKIKSTPNFHEKEAVLFSTIMQQAKVSLVDERLLSLLSKIERKKEQGNCLNSYGYRSLWLNF